MKFDCIVLGSGPAGFYSALSCAKAGLKTAIIEKELWGGTGFRTGCLPVKRNLDVLRKIKEAASLTDGQFILSDNFYKNLLKTTQNHISKIDEIMRKRLSESGISIFFGNGEFIDNKRLILNDTTLEAGNFIIATGTSPSAPEGLYPDGKTILSHIEALTLKVLPDRLIIIGGNVEGIEIASLFSSLGVLVTIVELGSTILPGTDNNLADPVIKELKSRRVKIITNAKATSIYREKETTIVVLDTGTELVTDKVVITGFRKMNIPDGLEKTGVIFGNKGIAVNDKLQTNIPNIYAAGDINGLHGMAHIAIQQGMLITKGLNGEKVTRDYTILPRAMFTIPEIGGAGKQEIDMIEENIPYFVKTYSIKDTWRGFSKNSNKGVIKLVFDKEEILRGIWMTGADASEIMSASGLLINRKITAETLLDNLFIHPSTGEGIVEALFINP